MKRREKKSPQPENPSPDQRSRFQRRRRGKHDSDKAGVQVPAVLPVVIAEAHGEELTVTLSGRKDTAETVPRAEFAAALAQLVADLGVPTRVEVHESDGRVLADILNPPHQPEPEETEAPDSESEDEARAELVEVSGDEFTPGEAVAIAVILRHTTAESTGIARTLVDPALLPGAGGAEVVMIGRDSQTVTVRPLT